MTESFALNFKLKEMSFYMYERQDISGWAENDRGVSFIFGPDIVATFLQKQDPQLTVYIF